MEQLPPQPEKFPVEKQAHQYAQEILAATALHPAYEVEEARTIVALAEDSIDHIPEAVALNLLTGPIEVQAA